MSDTEDLGFRFLSEKKDKAITLRLGENMLDWLDKYAKRANMSRTAVITQALVEFACRFEGVRTAQFNMDSNELLKSMAKHLEIVPGEGGKMAIQVCDLGVVQLNGEEISQKETGNES